MDPVMTKRSRRGGTVVLVLLAVAAFALAVLRGQQPPQGPVELAWDRERCAHCRMLVSEPGFAAQLHTEAGDVHAFDDPGCLMLWSARHADPVTGIWFHHLDRDRWLAADEVVFVPAEPTPMGYGLGARERGEAMGLSLAEARRDVAAREAARLARGGDAGAP